jgi:hypothetical protein
VCSAKGRRTFNNVLCAKYTFDERPSIFIRDKLIFSSERMYDKDYNRKRSVGKKFFRRESQEALFQDELTGGKPQVVK